jgi:pyocin large subunit-like protein
MSRRLISALALLGLIALAGATATGLLGGRADRTRDAIAPTASPPPSAVQPPRAVPAPAVELAPDADRGAGFRSDARLREHYDKHGREFGAASAREYVAMARALRDRPLGRDVQEATRADGVVTRFDRESGAFIAFEGDGTIRTFFKPRDGEAYFRRQRDRAPR